MDVPGGDQAYLRDEKKNPTDKQGCMDVHKGAGQRRQEDALEKIALREADDDYRQKCETAREEKQVFGSAVVFRCHPFESPTLA
jgi:hypothetical protein